MTEFEKWFNDFDPDAYKTDQLNKDVDHTSFEYCARNLRSAFEAGQIHPEWILVSDHLPTEKDGKIIINNSNWFESNQRYIRVLCKYIDDGVTIETFQLTGNFFCVPDYNKKNIIAWRRLPE